MSDWKTVVRLGLIYLAGSGKVKPPQAEALRQILASGTAEEALEKLLEAWLESEMGEASEKPQRLTPAAQRRLGEIEARLDAIEAKG